MNWPDKDKMAQHICEAADASGCQGKQWGHMAHSITLWVELSKAMIAKLNDLGYKALPRPVKGNEMCRLEGKDVIVVVQSPIEKATGGCWVSYDHAVCCRKLRMRKVISKALMPLVQDYGRKAFSVLQSVARDVEGSAS